MRDSTKVKKPGEYSGSTSLAYAVMVITGFLLTTSYCNSRKAARFTKKAGLPQVREHAAA
jgi:hypothetical protein